MMDQVSNQIDVKLLIQYVLLTLVLPFAVAITIDLVFGFMPFFTIGAIIIFIPLSTVVVIRKSLMELNRVIDAVAPIEEVETQIDTGSENTPNSN
ncbi:MAG: hypothetical protein AAF639_37510 [Chloroflexota bacterium]